MSSSKDIEAHVKDQIKRMIEDELNQKNPSDFRFNSSNVLQLEQEQAVIDLKKRKKQIKKNQSHSVYRSDPISALKSQIITREKVQQIDRKKKLEKSVKTNKALGSLPKFKIVKTQLYAQSNKERRENSVVNITSLTKEYGLTDGISDERMCVMENNKLCITCNRDERGCRGHCGHIDLPVEYVNPIFQKKCIQTLQCICPYCGHTYIDEQFAAALKISSMPEEKRLQFCASISDAWLYKLHNHTGKLCKFEYSSEFTGYKLFYKIETNDGKKQYERSIKNMKDIFTACPINELRLIGYTGGTSPLNFFMDCISVLPMNLRPPAYVDGKPNEHFLTKVYNTIMTRKMRLNNPGNDDSARQKEMAELYSDIKSITYGPEKKSGEKIPLKDAGIFKSYSTKKGTFRGNAMGKRVNYCLRSVAGPGYKLHPGESGVPKSAIYKMFVLEIVCKLNLAYMIKRYRQGDFKFIKMPMISEHTIYEVKSSHLTEYTPKIGDYFYRRIETGDPNMTGRQPSLHGPSILGYTTVISETEQCQIISADNSCKNADFDGDEFTQHIPQSITAMCEALTIHNFKANIMNAESNRPMIALAFHGLIGWFLATADWKRGYIKIPQERFEQALSLVKDSLRKSTLFERVDRVSRYIGKQIPHYSGHVLFSLCLPTNFTYSGNGVKIIDGIMYEGTLKKSNIGLSSNSLVQIICKMYSIEEAARFINDGQFLADWFTMWHGLSMGYKDFNANRKEVLKKIKKEVAKMQIEYYNLGPRPTDPIKLYFWLRSTHNLLDKTKKLGKEIGEEYILKNNSLNILSADMGSGAKGGATNTSQITGSLGVQFIGTGIINFELKGKTRSSPFYMPNDVSVEAIGYIVNSYMDGISVDSAIFHYIASRLGLVDTAKSTAEVGYTHRRVVKTFENLVISWLGMVTSTDGRMFCTMFNSGFDVGKMMEIKTKKFGKKVFFADFNAEAELLNRIHERKHLGGKRGKTEERDPIKLFIKENNRRPRLSEIDGVE